MKQPDAALIVSFLLHIAPPPARSLTRGAVRFMRWIPGCEPGEKIYAAFHDRPATSRGREQAGISLSADDASGFEAWPGQMGEGRPTSRSRYLGKRTARKSFLSRGGQANDLISRYTGESSPPPDSGGEHGSMGGQMALNAQELPDEKRKSWMKRPPKPDAGNRRATVLLRLELTGLPGLQRNRLLPA